MEPCQGMGIDPESNHPLSRACRKAARLLLQQGKDGRKSLERKRLWRFIPRITSMLPELDGTDRSTELCLREWGPQEAGPVESVCRSGNCKRDCRLLGNLAWGHPRPVT